MAEKKVEIVKSDIVILHSDPQNISQDSDYFHFADVSEKTYRIKNNRTQSIELIKNNLGRAVRLNYGNYMNNEFIHNIDLVEDELPEPVKPPATNAPPRTEPAPQAVGMITKEIGDMIRAKYLVSIFGGEISKELIKWYRSQTLGITKIPFDGAKLPQFKEKKNDNSD